MIALVVDEDLRSTGDLSGEPDREAVRVGRGHGELPERQPEPASELLASGDRVLRRQHVGDAAAHLALDRGDRRRGPVAGHRTGVAEAEIDVVMAVDAVKARARGRFHEEGKGRRPLAHPVHRDAVEERVLRLLEQLGGAGVSGAEAIRLLGHQAREAGSVDGVWSVGRHRPMMRPGVESTTADPAGRDRRRPITGWAQAAAPWPRRKSSDGTCPVRRPGRPFSGGGG